MEINQLDKKETSTKKEFNAGPLGLIAFAMTTILLNLHNAGAFELNVMIAAMGFAFGGIAQIIAGIFEAKHGKTFTGTAFIAFGSFWISLVFIWWNPFGLMAANGIAMGWYLLLWGFFTAFMFIGALKHNMITRIIFGTLILLFLMLAIGDFTGVKEVTITAGVIGIICGLSAFYSAVGQIVNGEYNKKIFPLM